jgi:MFS family permease
MRPASSPTRTPASGILLVQVFSSLGHGIMHLLAAYFYVVLLPLEREWQRPYAELVGLWTAGSALVGVMALPAGWLADRWSARGMLVVFFVGLGLSSMACGLATGPGSLQIALCFLGAFAAIYHPVGLPWVVRHSTRRGRALGVNGIFGSLGVAAAGIVAGALSDAFGWRVAFVVPGVVSVAIGLAMLAAIRRRWLPEERPRTTVATAPAHAARRKTFAVLVVTMASGSLIYQATQAALPKLFDLRVGAGPSGGTLGIGALVGLVYALASLTQVWSGHLADRFPLKRVYLVTLASQLPLLLLLSGIGGLPLVLLAAALVVVNTGALPAENLLLSASAPGHRQATAFGLRFVLIFGTTPFAIALVSWLGRSPAGFPGLFFALALLATLASCAALALPASEPADAGAAHEAAARA